MIWVVFMFMFLFNVGFGVGYWNDLNFGFGFWILSLEDEKMFKDRFVSMNVSEYSFVFDVKVLYLILGFEFCLMFGI